MKVLLTGPHGGFNLGDEFILSEIVRSLHSDGHAVSTMSYDPRYSAVAHGVPTIPRLNIKSRNFKALKMLKNFDVVVVAGGEQLQEARFGNPFWGHLADVWLTVKMAKRAGCRVMLWAVGGEELRSPLARLTLKNVLRNADVTTARDAFTQQYLQRHSSKPIGLSADPVFLLEEQNSAEAKARVQRRFELANRPLILLCPANDKRNDLSYIEPLLLGMREAAQACSAHVLVLGMEHQKGYDNVLLAHPTIQESSNFVLVHQEFFNRAQITDLFAAADVVVSARMHPLIIASTQKTPWIAIARNRKLHNFCALLGVQGLDNSTLTSDVVKKIVVAIFNGDISGVSSVVGNSVTSEIVSRAALNKTTFDEHIAR